MATIWQDTFTGAPSLALTNHQAQDGAGTGSIPWVRAFGVTETLDGAGALRLNASSASPTVHVVDVACPSACSARMTFGAVGALPPHTNRRGIALRVDTADTSGTRDYYAVIPEWSSANSRWEITPYQTVNGVTTAMTVTTGTSAFADFTAGQNYQITAALKDNAGDSGVTLTVTLNDTQLYQVVTTSGRIAPTPNATNYRAGVFGQGPAGAAGDYNFRVYDMNVGDIPAAPAATADHLAIQTQPVSTVIGQPMPAIVVRALSPGGVVDTSVTRAIQLAWGNNPGNAPDPAGTLVRNMVAGVATFDDIVVRTLQSQASFTFLDQAGTLTAAMSSAFNITAGAGGGATTLLPIARGEREPIYAAGGTKIRTLHFYVFDHTNNGAPKTGLSGSATIFVPGAAAGPSVNSITEIDSTNLPGLYSLLLTPTERGVSLGKDDVVLLIKVGTFYWISLAQGAVVTEYDPNAAPATANEIAVASGTVPFDVLPAAPGAGAEAAIRQDWKPHGTTVTATSYVDFNADDQIIRRRAS